MSKKKNEEKSMIDLYKSIRKDWNGVNPVTRIVESKKRKKPKYKKKEYEDEESCRVLTNATSIPNFGRNRVLNVIAVHLH